MQSILNVNRKYSSLPNDTSFTLILSFFPCRLVGYWSLPEEVSYCIYAPAAVSSREALISSLAKNRVAKQVKLFTFSPQGGGIKVIDRRYGQPVYPSSPRTNHVLLLPENFLVAETRQPIGRRDFLSMLAKITSVMVRASYSTEPSAVYR